MEMTKHNYSFSYNDKCLFYNGELACIKYHGIILCNEKFQSNLEEIVTKLDIYTYVYENLEEYNQTIKRTIQTFMDHATKGEWIDPIIITFINRLGVTFSSPFLNHCKMLSAEEYEQISEKRKVRKRNKESEQKKLDGLWYVTNCRNECDLEASGY